MSSFGRFALLLLVAGLSAVVTTSVPLLAQSSNHSLTVPGEAGRLKVRIRAVSASARPGGYGYVRVQLRNESKRDLGVDCVIRPAYDQDGLRSEKRVPVPAGGVAQVVDLPLPTVDRRLEVAVSIPGGTDLAQMQVDSPSLDVERWSLAVVEGYDSTPSNWSGALQAVIDGARGNRSGSSYLAISQRLTPADLPSAWWMLSGFDLIVVDRRTTELTEASQSVLRDYLLAGGTLLVRGGDAIAAGPLRSALDAAREEPGGTGLRRLAAGRGHALLLTADAATRSPGVLPDALVNHLFNTTPALALGGEHSGVVPAPWFEALEIPGIGELPRTAFLLLLAVFVATVGPINYFWLKRRRRLAWLLVTVPSLGFGVAALILLYGIFGEGFSVRAVRRSYTWLDQRDQTAVRLVQAQYFAGFGPSSLQPAADALFEGDRGPGGELTRPLWFRSDGSVGGDALPSRTPTSFATVQVTTERARIRFRATPDGQGYELLEDAALRPLASGPTVLMRDFDGDWYRSEAARNNRLEPCDATAAFGYRAALTDRLDLPLAPLSPDEGYDYALSKPEMDGSPEPTAQGVADQLQLAPGEYLMLVEQVPGGDTLGLEAEELRGVHLVHGRLAPEDLLR